ncbi:MAG: Stp1/IreP family PP2C-type Ser/Thr phosphatase [Firmicutes bacterium]|nr:Stp1/IreP family PP2C-type Ser/Thr phosphatase [Bacillota bacterium]
MRAVGRSVPGLWRDNNEDAIYLSSPGDFFEDLYIVADGMGGHNAGEVASSLAVESFLEFIAQNAQSEEFRLETLELMVSALIYSNRKVYEKSLSKPEFYGMGTTFLAACIKNSTMFIVHVGDCRAYLLRNGSLSQLTKDHSWVMEMVRLGQIPPENARTHPKRNVITRALGTDSKLEPDTLITGLFPNDIILLCSDGLNTMVDDTDIEAILNCDTTLEEKTENLILSANANGGKDNISIIIMGQGAKNNAE